MRVSPAGREFLIAKEGISLERYRDSAGLWTVGVGHLLKAGENYTTITMEQALALLDEDLRAVEATIGRLVRVPLNQNQYDALASWTFNFGETKLKYSTLLFHLNAGRYREAADEFPRWCKAKDPRTGEFRTVAGLLVRREEERALFLKPVGQTIQSEE